jgi:hypothetical protein
VKRITLRQCYLDLPNRQTSGRLWQNDRQKKKIPATASSGRDVCLVTPN